MRTSFIKSIKIALAKTVKDGELRHFSGNKRLYLKTMIIEGIEHKGQTDDGEKYNVTLRLKEH